MQNRKFRVILIMAIILLIALMARFYKLDQIPPGLYPDEAVNATDGLRAWDQGDLRLYYPNNNGREGLFINLVVIFLKIFDISIAVFRIVPALIGLLTIPAIYLAAKEMFNFRVGLLSAFICSVSFWHINFSRIGFRAILVPLITCLVLFFLFKGQKQIDKELSHRIKLSQLLNFLMAGLILGLGIHTYIAFRVFPAVVAGFFGLVIITGIMKYRNRVIKKMDRLKAFSLIVIKPVFIPIVTLIIGFCLTAGPMIIYYLNNPQSVSSRQNDNNIFVLSPANHQGKPVQALTKTLGQTLGQFIYKGDQNWRHNLPDKPQLSPFVAIMFLVGLLSGLGLWLVLMYVKWHKANIEKFRKFYLKIINILLGPKKNKKLAKKPWQKILRELRFKRLLSRPYRKILTLGTLMGWFLVMLSPAFLTIEGIPHALRSIGALPPAIMFASLVIAFLTSKQNRDRAAIVFNKLKIKKPDINANYFYLFNYWLVAVALGLTMIYNLNNYFLVWGRSTHTAHAFEKRMVNIGEYLKKSDNLYEKYLIVNAQNKKIDTGFPVSLETIRFVNFEKSQNLNYLNPDEINQINLNCEFEIILQKPDQQIERKIKEHYSVYEKEVDLTPEFQGTQFKTFHKF
ncbi:MAG: hypothetical protein GF332_04045 [Candidatus Moranbacteria bacterium]|nr:hypothetical protein [Candidatus Moranbacteria bacterium]